MSDKIYVGNGKERKFDNGGSIVKIMLDVDTLSKNFKEYGFTTEQGKRMMPINVATNREPDRYGNTHNATIDTFKPTPQSSSNTEQVKKVFQDDMPDAGEIPF